MTRKEFIKVLEEKEYSYEIEGNKVVVTNLYTIYLDSLTSLPPDVVFKNGGYVNLKSLTSIPPGVVFKNGEVVILDSLIGRIGGEFDWWNSNIEGINNKRLLNKMIKDGVFER